MRATCLINSFNYRSYVVEAVESVLGQSHPFDQILVVDDGSTDGSQELLKQRFEHEPRVQIICKQNGGQLSCFNVAMPEVVGDLLFFLDADDRYRPDYLATALEYFEQTGADFLIAGMVDVGPGLAYKRTAVRDIDLGFSVLSALYERAWVGAPTSGLSLRTSLAREILPYPGESEWRIRADMVLVYAASILGGHKYAMGQVCVERRVHGSNLYYDKRFDPTTLMRQSLALNRVLAWYAAKANYHASDLPHLLPIEFATQERPSFKDYRRYVRMSRRSPLRLVTRIKHVLSISAYMLRAWLTRPKKAPSNIECQQDLPNQLALYPPERRSLSA